MEPIHEQIIQSNSVNQIDWSTEKKIGPIHDQNIRSIPWTRSTDSQKSLDPK